MKLRSALLLILVGLLGAAAGWYAARRPAPAPVEAADGRQIKFYQSPMHPWITSDEPGRCTICGMALAPVYEGEAGFGGSADLVQLPAATATVIGVATTRVEQGPLARTLRLTGVIEDDDTRHHFVSSWTTARIERLFVDEIGEAVTAGEPLAEVYSRELLVARQEFRALARQPGVSTPLLLASRAKLLQLGLLESQIDELAEADEVTTNTLLLAPTSGVIIARSDSAYVGAYAEAGAPLFTLADFSRMWVQLDVYEPDLPFVRPGRNVKLDVPSLPGTPITAPVTFIDPNLDPVTRTARARVVVDNADRRLLHGQTVSARLETSLGEVLIVPRSAVLFTREQPVAFVARGETAYEARQLRLGRSGDTGYEVLEGLAAGDAVVTRAALLLEGQAQLAHSSSAAPSHEHGGPSAGPARDAAPAAQPEPAAAKVDPDAIEPLALAAADTAAALANDDLEAYRQALPALRKAWKTYATAQPDAREGELAQQAAALRDGPDIRSARRAFEPFSTTIADLARAAHLHHRGTVHVFQCPMTPVLGSGRWVQRDDKLRNPFFGSAMLTCGEELE